MDLQLGGRTALVTGGSRGIGRAIARELANEGVRVAICARTASAVADTAEQLRRETGGEVVGMVADTGTRDAVIHLVERVTRELGPVEILINNAATAAGRSKPPGLSDISREALLTEIDVKVLGYLFASQAVAPAMRDAGWGRIVNIAGMAAHTTGSIIGSIRNVSVAALTKNLADELGPFGITVNCVHPGLTRTVRSADATDPDVAARAAMLEDRIPRSNTIKQMIDDVHLAPLVAFLASPLSFVVNGESIEASGGTPGTIRY
jgi:NAD(P)-dependent dehydrogenase (short-subunit alcohol dehydrogenase family)